MLKNSTIEEKVFKEKLSYSEVSRVGPNLIPLISLSEEEIRTWWQVEERSSENTGRRGPSTRRLDREETNSANNFFLDFQPPET